jgi:hypothetical protein
VGLKRPKAKAIIPAPWNPSRHHGYSYTESHGAPSDTLNVLCTRYAVEAGAVISPTGSPLSPTKLCLALNNSAPSLPIHLPYRLSGRGQQFRYLQANLVWHSLPSHSYTPKISLKPP